MLRFHHTADLLGTAHARWGQLSVRPLLPGFPLGGGFRISQALLTLAWMDVLPGRRSPPKRLARLFGDRKRTYLHEWLPRGLRRRGLVAAQDIREGRFQRSLSLVAGLSAILGGLEVAYEHYRGSYGNRMMYTPVLLTPPLLGAALWSFFDKRASRVVLPAISSLVILDGLVGVGFHIRGIQRKPGGWRLPVTNIVMGPPLLAPLLFALPGYLGLIASFLRREDDPRGRFMPLGFRKRRAGPGLSWTRKVREGRFQRHLAAATAVAAVGSGLEALYSHYKNNFRYRVQWTPIVVAPLLAGAGIAAVFSRSAAHSLLPAASLLALANGGAGFAYHVRGVLRRPGGRAHLLYNVMYGPPVFAPLLFAGAGFLGILASLLRRSH